ncbi:type II RES/Xre toxin-antitoxin system antitoxin [Lunatibacter salilacus]|uniref:type II RES/Xre toxin-antitoxin system antitoxin n=1 Tax=Lunatibacter salilacus TaxID=2483804 RepID=UPI00131E1492|nr:antitoxin Xre/MbcA/ParS toxin-binding domain-containing protein [Lunatibacter salilacus]
MENIVSDFHMVYQVDRGVHVAKFDQLLEHSGIQKQVLANLLGLDPRTIDNYRKQGRNFPSLEGELLLKITQLFKIGEEVFGGVEAFRDWLNASSEAFDQRKPITFLNTSTGVVLVQQALLRIAYGYAV